MAAKENPPKTLDVTTGKQPRPSATARPIVVTNRSMIAADPMVVTGSEDKTPDDEEARVSVKRQGKTIEAPAGDAKPAAEDMPTTVLGSPEPEAPIPAETLADKPKPVTKAAVTEVSEPKEAPEKPVAETEPKPKLVSDLSPEPEPEAQPKEAADKTEAEQQRDPEAETAAGEAAEDARQVELDNLIKNGTYAVPVSSAYQQSSWVVKLLLILLAIALAAAVFDVALDNGLLTLHGVPHTHFFK